jgi:hypothetical protein
VLLEMGLEIPIREQVQSMFLPEETIAYRQLENVLISAHGFPLTTGRSEFESRNFAVGGRLTGDAFRARVDQRLRRRQKL